jgi:hypothetical protein
MKRSIFSLLPFLCLAFLVLPMVQPRLAAAEVSVVTAAGAGTVEREAAKDLLRILGTLYPRDRFLEVSKLPVSGKAILIGREGDDDVRKLLGEAAPGAAESYRVRHVSQPAREIGLVAGADARGTSYGVYAVLERLGCRFTISGDALPEPSATFFSFENWHLDNQPLVRERVAYNWHNFLSGCSTWNLGDWKRWIEQSRKMGFNTIMVHAYGNNPMAAFDFEGVPKPAGWLSTTIKGRDWSTMHVNDVRRMFGGEVFSGPAFGADAGLVPDESRVAAAQALMRDVFAEAGKLGLGSAFCLDVDTPSANPPEQILRLPESARFEVNGATLTMGKAAPKRLWIPNPDTPEGYAYYRAQVEGLVRAYPGMTQLVVWYRRSFTPWMELTPADFPPAWRQEYAAELERTPEAGKYWRAPGLFAVGKIVRAFERALKEIPGNKATLAAGTWAFECLPGADRFFPKGLPLVHLDWEILNGKPQLAEAAPRAPLREVGARRPVIPIVWAHHDDGQYVGRPYVPFSEFASKLEDAKASGYGVVHWTTRPLDLYFASLAKQVWSQSKDEALSHTCHALAATWFGEANRGTMGEYLESWLATAPQFGRDTSDRFMDRKLTRIPEVLAGCRTRLALIERARGLTSTPEQRERLAYYEGQEHFIAAMHEAQGKFQDSMEKLQGGDREAARSALSGIRYRELIEDFARYCSLGGITRGEQGLVVSLNTRWLSHIVRLRQALGEEPLRIRFSATAHELMAQSPGSFTFHFERTHELWECWGAKETGAELFSLPVGATVERGSLPAGWEEFGQSGLLSSKPLTLELRPILAIMGPRDGAIMRLSPGEYRLRLLFSEPDSVKAGERVFRLETNTTSAGTDAAFQLLEQIDIVQLAGGSRRLIERDYPIQLPASSAGVVRLRLVPLKGKALLCGAVLEPTRDSATPDKRSSSK